jgi:hypothetical protein
MNAPAPELGPPVKIPSVARPKTRAKVAPYAVALSVIGLTVFASLSSNRAAREEEASALPPLKTATITAPAPVTAALKPQPQTPAFVPPISKPPTQVQPARVVSTPSPVAPNTPAVRQTVDEAAVERQRRHASPTLIIDIAPARTNES